MHDVHVQDTVKMRRFNWKCHRGKERERIRKNQYSLHSVRVQCAPACPCQLCLLPTAFCLVHAYHCRINSSIYINSRRGLQHTQFVYIPSTAVRSVCTLAFAIIMQTTCESLPCRLHRLPENRTKCVCVCDNLGLGQCCVLANARPCIRHSSAFAICVQKHKKKEKKNFHLPITVPLGREYLFSSQFAIGHAAHMHMQKRINPFPFASYFAIEERY